MEGSLTVYDDINDLVEEEATETTGETKETKTVMGKGTGKKDGDEVASADEILEENCFAS